VRLSRLVVNGLPLLVSQLKLVTEFALPMNLNQEHLKIVF
jgi:hypothetical protein